MARQPTETRRNTRAPLIEGIATPVSAATAPTQPPLRSNPANENDPSTAMMMRRLRRSPSYDGIWISLIISAIWAIGWFFGYKDVLIGGQALSLWGYMQGLAWLVLPPAAMIAIAFNMWRSQQLRNTSEVLMQQAMRLINPQDIATEGLTSIAQSVRQEVDMLVGGVEHALQRATALEEIVHKEVSAVERAFGSNEERIRSLVNGLETQRAALLQTSTQVAADAQPMLQRLEANTHGLTQVVNVALTTFGRIEEGLKSSTTDLSRTIDDVSARTAETTNAIGQQSQQFERISTMLLSDFRGFSGDLQVQLQTLNTTATGLGNESRQFNTDMKDMEQNLTQLLKQNTVALSNTHSEFSHNLNHVTENVAGQLRSAQIDSAANLERAHSFVQDGMQNITNDYAQKLQAVRGEILSQFNDSTGHMITELDSANLRFHENFTTSSSRLFAQMDQTSTHLVGQLGASGSGVIGAIQQSAEEYSKTLTEVQSRQEALASNLQGSLSRTTSLLSQEMQSAGTNVNELLVNTSSTIAAHLKESSDIVSRQMQDSGFALAQNMEKSSGDLTDKLITISGEFVHKLGNAREGLLTSFLGASGELISKLEDTSVTIFDRLHSTNNEITGRIGAVSTEINDQLLSTNNDVTDRLERVSSDITGQLQSSNNEMAGRLARVSTDFVEQLQSTNNDVTERLGRVSTDFAEQLHSTNNDISERLERATSDVTGQLHSTHSELTGHFDNVSSKINDRLNFTALEITQHFNEATDRLDLASTEATTKLDSHGKRFVETIDGASGRIFTDLGNARDAFAEGLGETTLQISGRFEQETGLLLNRIDKSVGEFNSAAKTSSDKLQEASGIFAKHMSGTQGMLADQLANAATDIDQRLESVSLKLTGKLETTGSKISERLDDVSTLVDKSIDKFNLEMEHMLTSRRDMLDSLVNDANRRATEVDKTMTNYMTMIEESLSAAEERARHLGRIVADQSGAALANLEEQLRKLETNSGGQIAQAARALREQHERALSNMNEMLSSTASDFQQTAQDMRITAQQVVKDIDVARGELKRAVIDLPEETRNNADAMRRVVADQIGALNALADVVRKQSGSLDYSTPSYAPPRPAAISAPRFEASAPVAVLARPEPVALAAPRLASLGREIESANAKLNVSARDVVEAIEGQLPRDLERRYANSDKGAYAKRLFESRSRKLVKALEARYSEERLLRSRVQAYNRLFEKLLDTIAATDGADEVMEQVLASDQGRIYVMLAEIAGRMPNQS